MPQKWEIAYRDKETRTKLVSLLLDETIGAAVKRALRLLIEEDDPRHPTNDELDVIHLADDAPNWFRLKLVDKPELNHRLFFRMIWLDGKKPVEYAVDQLFYEDADNYIEYLDHEMRGDDTYSSLRKFYGWFQYISQWRKK